MGKEKKKHKKDKVVEAEFEISMHCNACERTVAKAISKIKGVETFTTDMRAHRVRIKGQINPEKVLKKLKKKTGKKVEVVTNNKNDDKKNKDKGKDDNSNKDNENKDKDKDGNSKNYKDDSGLEGVCLGQVTNADSIGFESNLLTMFSDENPNACSIM